MSAEATGWVYRHSPFKGPTFAVHHAIADSANDQNRNEFWMAVDKLATKARISRRSAQDAVQVLTANGFLCLLSPASGRPGDTNRYRFIFPDTEVVYESRWTETGAGGAPLGQVLRVHLTTETGAGGAPKPKETTQTSKSKTLSRDFDTFWSVYPLHKAKPTARRAWDRAVKRATAETIIEGAQRYAKEKKGEGRFVAHPSTWLNGDRWADEPTKPSQTHLPANDRAENQISRDRPSGVVKL